MSNRKSKLCSLSQALSGIKDGAKVMAAGAHYNNIPMALVRELIRCKVKNLEIIPTPSAGLWVDMLIGAGMVSKVHVSYIGMEFLGLAPNFRRAAEAKTIVVEEKDEPTIFHGLRAAGSGLPFVALPPLQKMTDLPKVSPATYREITDPFTGEPALAIAPLAPDVALIHFAKCDQYGNGVSIGGRHMEDIIAKASKRVIVSAEEIIPTEEITAAPTRTTLPGVLVDAVVHAPWGCYPGTCPGVYGYDRVHLEQYYELARKGQTQAYLDRFVFGCSDDSALLGAVSKEHLASLRIS
ncbi:MAG: CoA transferase subunit A [Betaproteobacteria bacterium]|nr:CoA transferase subunit A [Betaproteobacteria bacterium]